MNSFYKILSFIVFGFFFAFLTFKLQSTFADKFVENLLVLLTTLFAINIASSSLIANKVRDIQDQGGGDFQDTKSAIKNSFYEQIIIIGLAFIFSLIRDSKALETLISKDWLHIICDSILFFCFIYFLDIIRDIGKALFSLLS